MNQALLIIDAQQELIDGNETENGVYDKVMLINRINLAIEKAQEANAPIICVRDVDVSEGEGAGFQIHEEIQIPSGVMTFDKQATNSFHGTDLKNYLFKNEIDHLVIMGCQTEHCIDTAVRTATISGFDVTLVENGHSTVDSEDFSAEQIIKHHNRVLHGHYNVEHFSIVRKVEENLFHPTHDTYR
ncbi:MULTISPECIES: cysteine hydrolase family protein [Virgibacillus]|uniref:cysteine hydrolase family protein n=1 Tax=Virgibacillus TaxID=84406 RepID=UPI0004CFC4CE|nr:MULTISPECIES: cysteine hydrolase family protein [Virgibacillus]MYL43395.1 isochorismatase family protein [Virgibacillus massiliensis]